MTVKRWLIAFTLIVGVLAGCGTNPPSQVDWCYRFDLSASNYSSSLVYGTWAEGVGFSTGGDLNQLSFGYVYSQTVAPSEVIVSVARGIGVTGDINVEATGIIFGVAPNGAINQTLPSLIDSVDVPIEAQGSTDQGSSWNISVRASSTIRITAIEVRGKGANPFPSNTCGGTPTPSPTVFLVSDTPTTTPITPTPSPTPSSSPTPSPTPISSPTPTPSTWSHTWSVANGNITDWTAGVNGSVSPITGLTMTSDVAGTYYIRYPDYNSSTRWNAMELVYDGYIGNASSHGFLNWWATNSGGATRDNQGTFKSWSTGTDEYDSQISGLGAAVLSGYQYVFLFVQANSNNGSFMNIKSITWSGTGIDPFGSVPTPTMTFTPSLTPSNTPTSTQTVTLFPGTHTRTPTRTPVIVAPPSATVTSAPTNTLAPLPTTVPSATRTLIPAPTFVHSATPDLTATPTGGGDGSDDSHGGDILNAMGDFFNWIVNTALNFFEWLGSIFAWISGTLSNIGTLIGNFFQLISGLLSLLLALINSIIAIIGLIIAIIGHLLSLIAGWLSQLIARAQMVVNAWFTAAPTPIPFLPHCVTDPTASDVCAFYYVLDNTVLAGSVGGLLIPLITLLLDLVMVFYFIRTVRNLVRKTEAVSD